MGHVSTHEKFNKKGALDGTLQLLHAELVPEQVLQVELQLLCIEVIVTVLVLSRSTMNPREFLIETSKVPVV